MCGKTKAIKRAYIIAIIFILFVIPIISSKVASNKVDIGVSNQIEKTGKADVIIKLKDEGGKQGIFSAKQTEKEIKEEVKAELGNVDYEFSSFNGLSATISQEELQKLEENPNVEKIEYNHQFKAFLQDSAVIINASISWSQTINGINITGLGETICIVDTGVNYSHPDLGNCNFTSFLAGNCKVIAGYDFFNSDNNPIDDNGHGTHIAGIAAANGNIRGIAPDAKIVAMKVLDSSGNGDEADLIAGIEACIGNASLYNISVISLSLGTDTLYTEYCDSDFPSLSASINSVISKNISVIAAAGNRNSGSYTSIASPACIQNVTAVGAVDKSDSISFNRNKLVYLLAPGASINSTESPSLPICSQNPCKGNYAVMSGTSMSTPHVAASFMLVGQFYKLQNNTILSPKQIQDAFNKTGKRIYDSSSNLTFSRIDITAALQSLGLIINITTTTIQNITINQTSPIDNLITQQQQNFTCFVNSTNQLKNITLSLYNSTSLTYRETKNITNTINTTIFNYTNLTDDIYSWNCLVSDTQNYSTTSASRTLIFDSSKPIFSSYVEPTAYSPMLQINVTITDLSLSRVGIQFNNTLTNTNYSVSNLSNIFIFNISLAVGNYSYYWWANDSLGHYNVSGIRNLTINKATNTLTLASSAGWAYYSSSSSTLSCSADYGTPKLYQDDVEITNPTTASYSAGTYAIKCNISESQNYSSASTSSTLTITTPSASSSDSGSSSSGGGGATAILLTNPEGTTYVITEVQLTSGFVRSLKEKDKIKFTINSEQHLINLTSLSSTSANIRVTSEPQEATLYIEDTKKFELTGDSYYDVQIKLDNISDNKASFTINKTNETLETSEETNTNQTNTTFTSSSQLTGGVTANAIEFLDKIKSNLTKNNLTKITITIVILIAIILLIREIKLRKSQEPKKKQKTEIKLKNAKKPSKKTKKTETKAKSKRK